MTTQPSTGPRPRTDDPNRKRLATHLIEGLTYIRGRYPSVDDRFVGRFLSGFLGTYVVAIEAEARAAALTAVEEAVRALPQDRGDESWSTVSRNAVLAILDELQEGEQHRHSWSYLTDHTGECNDCGVTAPPFMPGGVHDCRATLAKLQEDEQ